MNKSTRKQMYEVKLMYLCNNVSRIKLLDLKNHREISTFEIGFLREHSDIISTKSNKAGTSYYRLKLQYSPWNTTIIFSNNIGENSK